MILFYSSLANKTPMESQPLINYLIQQNFLLNDMLRLYPKPNPYDKQWNEYFEKRLKHKIDLFRNWLT
ncbi:hypothetical protein OTSGILL_0542 [Orientia tsutsugamushi str. Gilliam]|uniref:Uncharacterized protein n=2 Tax=Orientia tsutsugamushi TaxID=784 RepID=A0A0F3MGJ6_ORITS|nr:hypothetical protein OTSGILL_0542 [Orientia tsutsugamushi str. Gilliam]KJV74630.1 hypothetical protein OTSUT76_2842 [Orientia tsutsugamushi str. UT76]SPR05655.1 Uncharacterised protein [Orientia tsutsugamushi]SPR06011.1 Uncharacterised protein [Orientia tsutsugamushi str. Gilliam]